MNTPGQHFNIITFNEKNEQTIISLIIKNFIHLKTSYHITPFMFVQKLLWTLAVI